ncbi:MAG TPA: DUF4397 domain-containing protein [Candidatus Kapabacteria bacterium]|nr:DUF4397 domain-containing protein [Candidatus Kapabacteria bacterium]
MKTRISSRVVAVCLLFLAAGIGLNSCKPELTEPIVTGASFGSIRVMNFRECPSEPFDVFIYKEGSLDTVITRALAYGIGSAYATNLIPGDYTIQFTPLNRRDLILASTSIRVDADKARSLQVFKGENDAFILTPSFDQDIAPDPTKVYVRFLNTKDIGNVDVVLDNPLGNATFDNVPPRTLTSYVPLDHALDTSYAVYLVNGDDAKQVISRMSGAAWGPGQFYTLVYAGNNNDCRDTAEAKADTLRLRYFDDNQQGNDLTFPVVQSLRFNFVNGLISPQNPGAGQRSYTTAGVVINNDDRFLIPGLKPKEVARNLGTEQDGKVIIGGFFTTNWTEAIQVSMYSVPDGNTDPRATRGTKLVDLRAGNRLGIESDVPFSIIIMDTVSNRTTSGVFHVDSSRIVSYSVPLPDVPTDQAQLVLVNALAYAPKEGVSAPSKYAKIYVNNTVAKLFTSPQRSPKVDNVSVDGGAPVEIKVEIGRASVLKTLTKIFTPEPRGIYEIVVVGQNGNQGAGEPEILVIQTNKVNQ